MSPRKRVRLTAKPKSHKVSRGREFQELRADGTPTEEEFASWDEYGRFVVTDQDEKSHEVKKGDSVMVLPPDPPEDTADFWIGRVRAIRSPSNDTHNVWVKVQWFYSPADLAPIVKTYADSLPPSPSSYCHHERIFSDHFDFVHHATIDGVVSVTRYEENSLSPPYIEPESFWTRYDYERGTRCILPRPLPFQCTDGETRLGKRKRKDERRCGAYQPKEIMHLCSNPGCMRWWHARCLSPSPSSSVTPPLPHRMRGKRKSGLVLDTLAIQRIMTSSAHLKTGAFDPSLLQGLGEDVITAASQPMVRGGRFGLVGNVREVAEARSRVLLALEQDTAFSEDCIDEDGMAAPPKKKAKTTKGAKSSKSRMASVKKKKQSESSSFDWESAVVDAGEAYTCPRCGGAI